MLFLNVAKRRPQKNDILKCHTTVSLVRLRLKLVTLPCEQIHIQIL